MNLIGISFWNFLTIFQEFLNIELELFLKEQSIKENEYSRNRRQSTQ